MGSALSDKVLGGENSVFEISAGFPRERVRVGACRARCFAIEACARCLAQPDAPESSRAVVSQTTGEAPQGRASEASREAVVGRGRCVLAGKRICMTSARCAGRDGALNRRFGELPYIERGRREDRLPFLKQAARKSSWKTVSAWRALLSASVSDCSQELAAGRA